MLSWDGWHSPSSQRSHTTPTWYRRCQDRGAISIRGDVKGAYDCNKESCEMDDRLAASTDLQELKEALVESPP
jgi:hypothetical protein